MENGWKVLFTRTTDLVQKLQAARRDLGLEAAINKLDRFDLRSAATTLRQHRRGRCHRAPLGLVSRKSQRSSWREGPIDDRVPHGSARPSQAKLICVQISTEIEIAVNQSKQQERSMVADLKQRVALETTSNSNVTGDASGTRGPI